MAENSLPPAPISPTMPRLVVSLSAHGQEGFACCYCSAIWNKVALLLMVQKSSKPVEVNTLSTIPYDGFHHTSQVVVWDFWTDQQYDFNLQPPCFQSALRITFEEFYIERCKWDSNFSCDISRILVEIPRFLAGSGQILMEQAKIKRCNKMTYWLFHKILHINGKPTSVTIYWFLPS